MPTTDPMHGDDWIFIGSAGIICVVVGYFVVKALT
jgi:hypothetical protein